MIRAPVLHELLRGCEVSPELLAYLNELCVTVSTRVVEEATAVNGERKLLHADAVERVLSSLFGDEMTKIMLAKILAHKHRGFTETPKW